MEKRDPKTEKFWEFLRRAVSEMFSPGEDIQEEEELPEELNNERINDLAKRIGVNEAAVTDGKKSSVNSGFSNGLKKNYKTPKVSIQEMSPEKLEKMGKKSEEGREIEE